MSDLCIIPASPASEGYVDLAANGPKGVLFRKHLLTLGKLNYGGKTYTLDDAWYGQLKQNFDAGVSMVQVPLADANNRHTEDPLRNAGEVVGLEREGSKVYSVVDIRDPKVADGLRRGTLMGASAMISMDYRDSRTDKKVGPALLHHCVTNRPHVLDLEPYEEIVAATSDASEDDLGEAVILTRDEEPEPEGDSADTDVSNVVLSTEDPVPTKEELIAQLKDHGIDVEALQLAAASQADTEARLSAVEAQQAELVQKAGTTLGLTGESLEQSDVVGAIVELARKNETLDSDVKRLTRKDAERTVQSYVNSGHLLAKTRDHAVEVYLAAGQEGLDALLAPEDSPYVKMAEQEGITGEGDGERQHDFDIDAEIARYGTEVSNLSTMKRK